MPSAVYVKEVGGFTISIIWRSQLLIRPPSKNFQEFRSEFPGKGILDHKVSFYNFNLFSGTANRIQNLGIGSNYQSILQMQEKLKSIIWLPVPSMNFKLLEKTNSETACTVPLLKLKPKVSTLITKNLKRQFHIPYHYWSPLSAKISLHLYNFC